MGPKLAVFVGLGYSENKEYFSMIAVCEGGGKARGLQMSRESQVVEMERRGYGSINPPSCLIPFSLSFFSVLGT